MQHTPLEGTDWNDVFCVNILALAQPTQTAPVSLEIDASIEFDTNLQEKLQSRPVCCPPTPIAQRMRSMGKARGSSAWIDLHPLQVPTVIPPGNTRARAAPDGAAAPQTGGSELISGVTVEGIGTGAMICWAERSSKTDVLLDYVVAGSNDVTCGTPDLEELTRRAYRLRMYLRDLGFRGAQISQQYAL